jgi:hypothetical protein
MRSVRVGGLVYLRRLNNVGVAEMYVHANDRWITEYIEAGGYAELRAFKRVEAVWRLMDVERKRDGSLRVYGEDMMHILRDTVLRAPAGTNEAVWNGDAGAGMVSVLNRVANAQTSAYYGAMPMLHTTYVPPTTFVSVSYAWATGLEAMREIATNAAYSGYRIWFGICSATVVPSLLFSIGISTPMWGRRVSIGTAVTERYTSSSEGTVAVSLGRGVGVARATHVAVTMRALSHRLHWREARIDARTSDSVIASAERGIIERMRDVDVDEVILPQYPDGVDLGDQLVLRTSVRWGVERRVVTGVRVEMRQGAIVNLETEEVAG